MSFAVYSIILICTVYVESAESQEERSKRIILHSEGDVLTVLRETQAEIDAMNATFTSILAQQKATFTAQLAKLESELQTEKQERLKLATALNVSLAEGCQTGVAHFQHEDCTKGQCAETVTVTFNPAFSKPPALSHGFAYMDVDATHNLRIVASNVQVTRYNATMKVSTYADTIIYASNLRWMACP